MQIVFLLGRIIFSLYWLQNSYHHLFHSEGMIGYAKMKGVPAPKAAILGTGVLLLVGGISMLLGVYPWVGLIALAIFLVGITFKMHQFWKAIDPMQKMGEEVNFYKNIALLGAVLMMFALPLPWPYSF